MAAYYAFNHPPNRVKLYGFYPNEYPPTGFLALAQTGLDLFRPLVVPFVGHPEALKALIQAVIRPERPALLYLPLEQRVWIEESVELTQVQPSELMRIDPNRFEPLINVLMVRSTTPTGLTRFEIRSQTGVHAFAGINWKGNRFAEVYVGGDPEARDRQFLKSVLAAITKDLFDEGRLALFRVEEGDTRAMVEAMEIGYRTTGIRVLTAQIVSLDSISMPNGYSRG
jgi:hypothetical protein